MTVRVSTARRETEMVGADTVSLTGMKARWAFSELKSERTNIYYHDPRAPALRAKIANLEFDQLTVGELSILAEMWEPARGIYQGTYLTDVSEFVRQDWSTAQLAEVWAMSQMDPRGEGRFRSMLAYAVSPRPPSETDPRVAADRLYSSGKSFRCTDPIVVGLFNGRRVLIDGYCRSILFMQSADVSDRIPVLVPIA
jgi:hypothetical protein